MLTKEQKKVRDAFLDAMETCLKNAEHYKKQAAELDQIEIKEKQAKIINKCFALRDKSFGETFGNMGYALVKGFYKKEYGDEMAYGFVISAYDNGEIYGVNFEQDIWEEWMTNGKPITRRKFDTYLSKAKALLNNV